MKCLKCENQVDKKAYFLGKVVCQICYRRRKDNGLHKGDKKDESRFGI